jgi:hypothetical protein
MNATSISSPFDAVRTAVRGSAEQPVVWSERRLRVAEELSIVTPRWVARPVPWMVMQSVGKGQGNAGPSSVKMAEKGTSDVADTLRGKKPVKAIRTAATASVPARK